MLGGKKRLRMEATEAGPSNARATSMAGAPTITNSTPSPEELEDQAVNVTKWIDKLTDKAIQSTGNIARSLCKKETALRRLEEQMAKDTCPASLRVSIKVQVTEPYQAKLDEAIEMAICNMQKTVVEELMKVRQEEAKFLKWDLEKVHKDWKESFDSTITQMQSEDLIQLNVANFKHRHHLIFEKKYEQTILEVRVRDFDTRKRDEEKKLQQDERRAEDDMDDVLRDPRVNELEKKLNTLEKKLKAGPSKNEQGKPRQGKTGTAHPAKQAGRNNNRAANKKDGKSPSKPKGKTNAKGKERNARNASENENQGPRSRRKGLTNPSALKKTRFQKKQK